MTAALRFLDNGYDVVTASWTVCTKERGEVEIAYLWGADGYSFVSGATGVSHVTIKIGIDEFARRAAKEFIVDLRGQQ